MRCTRSPGTTGRGRLAFSSRGATAPLYVTIWEHAHGPTRRHRHRWHPRPRPRHGPRPAAGWPLCSVSAISEDVEPMQAEAAKIKASDRFRPLIADIRKPAECDKIIKASLDALRLRRYPGQQCRSDLHLHLARQRSVQGTAKVLRGDRRGDPERHGHQLCRRRPARPPHRAAMHRQGLGRIVNVTTKLTHDESARRHSLRLIEGRAGVG